MNVYEIITERILAEIERGTLPWNKPWKSALGEEPANLVSKKGYRGINRFLLGHLSFERPYYVTYKQATDLGGNVRKGEKGTPVIFWKQSQYTKEDAQGIEQTENSFVLRYYMVFNVSQCEGIDRHLPMLPSLDTSMSTIQPLEAAEQIVSRYATCPTLNHVRGDRAYYQPSTDTVVLPETSQFSSQSEYYSTVFHELTHSTGHASRLNRPTLTDMTFFGSANYSKEELVAEMGAAFLCGEAGIENEAALKNSASYLDGWRKKLKMDSKIVIQAAGQAQKAADYILGVNREA